jgi:hypothetical protein
MMDVVPTRGSVYRLAEECLRGWAPTDASHELVVEPRVPEDRNRVHFDRVRPEDGARLEAASGSRLLVERVEHRTEEPFSDCKCWQSINH